jgi:hypothetical protein
MVTFFKEQRSVINKDSVENRQNTDIVFDHSWFYFMSKIVVNGVLHVSRHEIILKPLLVHFVILKYFTHDSNLTVVFLGVEADFKYSFLVKVRVRAAVSCLLIRQDMVQYLL